MRARDYSHAARSTRMQRFWMDGRLLFPNPIVEEIARQLTRTQLSESR